MPGWTAIASASTQYSCNRGTLTSPSLVCEALPCQLPGRFGSGIGGSAINGCAAGGVLASGGSCSVPPWQMPWVINEYNATPLPMAPKYLWHPITWRLQVACDIVVHCRTQWHTASIRLDMAPGSVGVWLQVSCVCARAHACVWLQVSCAYGYYALEVLSVSSGLVVYETGSTTYRCFAANFEESPTLECETCA